MTSTEWVAIDANELNKIKVRRFSMLFFKKTLEAIIPALLRYKAAVIIDNETNTVLLKIIRIVWHKLKQSRRY